MGCKKAGRRDSRVFGINPNTLGKASDDMKCENTDVAVFEWV
jgi:hypothetical protein